MLINSNTMKKIILFLFLLVCLEYQTKSQDLGAIGQTLSQQSAIGNKAFTIQISQVVRKIFEDSKGNIWFGTEGGAYRLKGLSLIYIVGIKNASGKGVTVKDITENIDGSIWIGHSDGISIIMGDSIKNYDESDGLISNDVWCIKADKQGKVWIGTIKGACVFNGNEFVKIELPEGEIDTTVSISSTKMVHSIFEDKKGKLWFCTNAGLYTYSKKKFINVSKETGMQTNFIHEVFEDKSGSLWISSKAGLYYLKDGIASNITQQKIEVGKGIGSIAQDNDGKIWFVSNQHFLYSYNGKDLEEFPKTEDNRGPVVFQIFKDTAKRLWFVGYGGAYRLENGRFINITKYGPW